MTENMQAGGFLSRVICLIRMQVFRADRNKNAPHIVRSASCPQAQPVLELLVRIELTTCSLRMSCSTIEPQ